MMAAPPIGVGRARESAKAPLARFLTQNPFGSTNPDGFFYLEKMRAIHRIAPDTAFARVLEVGGGQSGLTKLLYPASDVVNLDLNAAFADSPQNRRLGVCFVQGDATELPFSDASFDAITIFDLLEHVPDDAAAVREALRVLRPGGVVLLSTPNNRWRYPWYGFMRRICPEETELFARWGHVRRGYGPADLELLFGGLPEAATSFINPLTALCHDISFSHLGRRRRLALHLLAAPLTAAGWWLHELLRLPGTEIAARWRKPA